MALLTIVKDLLWVLPLGCSSDIKLRSGLHGQEAVLHEELQFLPNSRVLLRKHSRMDLRLGSLLCLVAGYTNRCRRAESRAEAL